LGEPILTDSSEELTAFVCDNIARYQVMLCNDAGKDHALGAVTKAEKGLFFDPSNFERSYDWNLAY
jgi:hypothetical protein